ncbi:hypothetical protein L3X38_005303 [Prunus dulcis]|uniref:Uncharacterized protein n=1 Tax=Prunus dulcis TaxID=3755 RepID=A0AAD5F3Z4_PRUDU|nr:hypothetical protein L3X38_005303 [Prunus dulcis]
MAKVMGLAGLNYASATLNTAMLNLIPAFTFILALPFSALAVVVADVIDVIFLRQALHLRRPEKRNCMRTVEKGSGQNHHLKAIPLCYEVQNKTRDTDLSCIETMVEGDNLITRVGEK